MKYAKSIPKTDLKRRESLLSKGWQPVKEAPNLLIAIVLSFPFMIMNALITYFVLRLINPNSAAQVIHIITAPSWEFTIRYDYLLYLILLVLVHEFLHLICIPNFYKSTETFWGIRPWGVFVYTNQELRKSRFLVISMVPFITLSILIPAILGLLGFLNVFILVLVFFNAIACSVDMLNFFTILVQVPGGSRIINNGFESYCM